MKTKKKQKHTRTQREHSADFITETKDFAGVIELVDGVKKMKVISPVWYQHQINKFKVGENVSVYISTRRPKRTMQQNRYYWLYLGLICTETGESEPDLLHRLFAGMFLSKGVYEVLGQKVRDVKSTTELSKFEFSEYIEKIAAYTQIEPPPTENYFEQSGKISL